MLRPGLALLAQALAFEAELLEKSGRLKLDASRYPLTRTLFARGGVDSDDFEAGDGYDPGCFGRSADGQHDACVGSPPAGTLWNNSAALGSSCGRRRTPCHKTDNLGSDPEHSGAAAPERGLPCQVLENRLATPRSLSRVFMASPEELAAICVERLLIAKNDMTHYF